MAPPDPAPYVRQIHAGVRYAGRQGAVRVAVALWMARRLLPMPDSAAETFAGNRTAIAWSSSRASTHRPVRFISSNRVRDCKVASGFPPFPATTYLRARAPRSEPIHVVGQIDRGTARGASPVWCPHWRNVGPAEDLGVCKECARSPRS